MKYVSFSLWGNDPFYNVGAIRNAELMPTIYPDWKMVLYYDSSVPQETITKLDSLGVITKDMTEHNLYGMFWRFFAADLEDCEYAVFRDTDSRISEREYMAVKEWIESGKTIHVMRDHPAHRIPYGNTSLGILGGMWGIKGGALPITDMINRFRQDKELKYGSDQTFLKTVYNVFQNDRTTHDPFFEKLDFPIKRIDRRFVGERIGIDDMPSGNDHMQIPL